jgi:hypothetical protein
MSLRAQEPESLATVVNESLATVVDESLATVVDESLATVVDESLATVGTKGDPKVLKVVINRHMQCVLVGTLAVLTGAVTGGHHTVPLLRWQIVLLGQVVEVKGFRWHMYNHVTSVRHPVHGYHRIPTERANEPTTMAHGFHHKT